MQTMEQVIATHCLPTDADRDWLTQLVDEWSLLADLAFADLILWVPDTDDNIFWACAQVRPTTGPTSLEDDVVGEAVSYTHLDVYKRQRLLRVVPGATS